MSSLLQGDCVFLVLANILNEIIKIHKQVVEGTARNSKEEEMVDTNWLA